MSMYKARAPERCPPRAHRASAKTKPPRERVERAAGRRAPPTHVQSEATIAARPRPRKKIS
eukprot:3157855-Prymnesium_polylepis.1